MFRSALARFWQVVLLMILLGALVTASIGGAQAQRNAPEMISAQAEAVSSALAKSTSTASASSTATQTAQPLSVTPTRKPKKTKTPTSTLLSATPTSTATAEPTATDAHAPTLPPGIYHFNGTLRALAKNILT